MTVKVFAPAKVNLTLHVTGQRDDGYHLIDSLVAFAPVGDQLTISDASVSSFTVEGPESVGVPADMNNLVMQVAEIMAPGRGLAMTLEKNIPVAAGLGGGSADAAAAARGLLECLENDEKFSRFASLSDSEIEEDFGPVLEKLVALGADIPMCFGSVPMRARGIGQQLNIVNNMPHLPLLLVNPRIPVATPMVFSALACKNNPPMAEKLPVWEGLVDFCSWMDGQRNDLQMPAVAMHKEIGSVLDALNATEGVLTSRMSGSGATCFAIHRDKDCSLEAAARMHAEHKNWWIRAGWTGSMIEKSVPVFS